MKIRITPGALLSLAVLFFSRNSLFLTAVICAVVHECGHLLSAKCLGIKMKMLELDVLGARLYPETPFFSYRSEAWLAVSGPLFSLLFGLLLPRGGTFFCLLRATTFSLGLFNLLPIRGMDGGRLLGAFLFERSDPCRTEKILFWSSYFSLLFLFSLSSCMLLRYGQNLFLAVLSASLFSRLFLSGEK